MQKTVVTINSNGRQSASFIRVASAIGWHVRAQMKDIKGIVAEEIAGLPNVTVFVGRLEDPKFLDDLFRGAQIAFINTTHWGDEVFIGRSLADAAKRAGIQHYIYSSMPDHSVYNKDWRPLPLWAQKFTIENYIRQIGLPATFVYCGIYHNNFTSLDFPLFRMELQPDKSFVWQAPFHPDIPLPWLDSEHDIGVSVLQIFKEGPRKWAGKRIPLAFSHLTPKQVCKSFALGLGRPVSYRRGPIEIHCPTPAGYREHLEALEDVLGKKSAPYFGPDLEKHCTKTALELWEGYRGIEEYAREVFPVEEQANGLTWMLEADPIQHCDDVELYEACLFTNTSHRLSDARGCVPVL
ncbi:NmrA-domain-containing protein [Delitschia confertaspora ATCC 74209]|uniref:NmrA-domain-containing protein n=1 Tax=Delitschia confertaspora ATCC 74209 TaxID=1513339 RepID=A0A9P4N246_9PLEO|nr:NmrA-domain-containing protein [Delitschia confertaspora ATCC 74209]